MDLCGGEGAFLLATTDVSTFVRLRLATPQERTAVGPTLPENQDMIGCNWGICLSQPVAAVNSPIEISSPISRTPYKAKKLRGTRLHRIAEASRAPVPTCAAWKTVLTDQPIFTFSNWWERPISIHFGCFMCWLFFNGLMAKFSCCIILLVPSQFICRISSFCNSFCNFCGG